MLNLGLTEISRSHFKEYENASLISHIYILRCFVNFWVISVFFGSYISSHSDLKDLRGWRRYKIQTLISTCQKEKGLWDGEGRQFLFGP